MNGNDIKEAIRRRGFSVSQVAAAIGESQQNLSAALSRDDVKSSIVERVAAFLGTPVSSLYGENNTVTASGNGSTAAGGNIVNDSMLIEEIAAQRKLTAMAMEQNGQLLRIIDNLTKK